MPDSRETYRVQVNASALRSLTVRAHTAEEALAIANGRISSRSGPWVIDFPGDANEHYQVRRLSDDTILGPHADGSFDDDPTVEEGDSGQAD